MVKVEPTVAEPVIEIDPLDLGDIPIALVGAEKMLTEALGLLAVSRTLMKRFC